MKSHHAGGWFPLAASPPPSPKFLPALPFSTQGHVPARTLKDLQKCSRNSSKEIIGNSKVGQLEIEINEDLIKCLQKYHTKLHE